MAEKNVIAVDLGAESGRVMRVGFDGKAFSLEEMNRFANTPIETEHTLYWNAPRLWYDIQVGLAKALAQHDISSIGVDTWGVDFALVDENGQLLDNPVHYRDKRTTTTPDWVFAQVSRREIFERTGIQHMPINTLFQLASLKQAASPQLELADTLLTIPALFTYWLSGSKVSEFSHVTTTQCYNPKTAAWDTETLDALGVPTHILPEVVSPGTRLGSYRGVPVIAPAMHDTGSAVVAVPSTHENYAYLSSGTWSLIGLEIPQPLINDAAFEANVTNEGGAYGTYRLLQNVMGLWLVQQSRATWAASGHNYTYDQLVQLAEGAKPFLAYVDPNDARFLDPGDMPARVQDYCRETGQPIPQTHAEILRVIFESLAFKYRQVLDVLMQLTGRTVERLHIIGGGSRNVLLNQLTANAIGRTVSAGPTEATALGAAIVQLIELGEIKDIWEARQILSQTTSDNIYHPQDSTTFDAQYQRFLAVLAQADRRT